MNESDVNLRALATKTLAMIAELYPHSSITKKLDGDDSPEAYEVMIATWMNALRGKSEQSVLIGLDTLLKSGSTFEPSVPEFVAMCKLPPESHREYKAIGYADRPNPGGPARIDHYPKKIREGLEKIGLLPRADETHHEYCMRCRDHALTEYGSVLPSNLR